MTKCRHFPGRWVGIEFSNALKIVENAFTIMLVKCDYLIVSINDSRCMIYKTALLCLNETDRIEVLAEKDMQVLTISFTPEFINPNLGFSCIRSVQYENLRKMHHYPDFDLFLHRCVTYVGILPANEEFFDVLHNLFDNIDRQVHEQPNPKWSCQSRSNLFSIFDIAEQSFLSLTKNPSPEEIVVQNIIRHIHLHISDHLSIEQLCSSFCTNRTKLTSQFKNYTGLTPINYMLKHRIELCKYDLAFTELQLQEIASKYTFFDATYFSKVFISRTGITPLQYRNRMRNARPNKSIL